VDIKALSQSFAQSANRLLALFAIFLPKMLLFKFEVPPEPRP